MKKLACLFMIISILVMFNVSSIWASSLNIPNTFTAGTTAVADEVNENFNEVKAAIDDNDSRITNHVNDTSVHHSRYTDMEALNTVLANDGDGSGLDADKIDGHDSTHFARSFQSCSGSAVVKGIDTNGDIICEAPSITGDGHSLDAADGDPIDSVFVDTSGNVGIGTQTPLAKLEILDNKMANIFKINHGDGKSVARIYNNNGEGILMVDNSGSAGIYLRGNGDSWINSGNIGIGTFDPKGKLDVNGSIYQRGSELHADYVFEPDYKLESIEEHAEFMWNEKHLKAIPKVNLDENGYEIIEVGAYQKGIVEELEKAHIYIEQLHKRIEILEETLNKLETAVYNRISTNSE